MEPFYLIKENPLLGSIDISDIPNVVLTRPRGNSLKKTAKQQALVNSISSIENILQITEDENMKNSLYHLRSSLIIDIASTANQNVSPKKYCSHCLEKGPFISTDKVFSRCYSCHNPVVPCSKCEIAMAKYEDKVFSQDAKCEKCRNIIESWDQHGTVDYKESIDIIEDLDLSEFKDIN
ncbi:hypothetical protein ROZALSC1DRAFT_27644 [Rozella allomycis CSF55]|uniref:Uncharacterized protein n=1 Tax=Rozella allomycis (strain CSF55) TaxID=988480 RepID=A0A075AXC7_ROZAC|nr:hypothetical protein O9G_002038 [Rozella allomycis CSF55]RKP20912.1 hypothetical protein ROZALSC1DRAFT_27644 [Rozella allomycis CSF55]|eukprot:EPZ34907.1 hypothetical protein O9G_002038 [Rozella allomycis CSF55]